MLPKPVPQTLIQTIVIPVEDTPKCNHGDGSAQPPAAAVAYNPTPAFSPTGGLPDLDARRLHRKIYPYRSPYGPQRFRSMEVRARFLPRAGSGLEVEPIVPGSTPLRTRATFGFGEGARGETEGSLLRKTVTVRPLKPQCSGESAPSQTNDHPKAVDPIPTADPSPLRGKGAPIPMEST